MYKDCPISCGVCTPECKDTKNLCEGWAAAGGCNDNPSFMALYCPVTCGVCKGACKDRSAECPGWTAQGECYENPQWMYHKCPSSCGVCETATRRPQHDPVPHLGRLGRVRAQPDGR